jgi:acyl transferase domain-containing protein
LGTIKSQVGRYTDAEAVSSFGFSGTNVHVVVGEHVDGKVRKAKSLVKV